MKHIVAGLLLVMIIGYLPAQQQAPKPLYDDPVYHGAADPAIIYNKAKNVWWMFYTNRRATLNDSTGVAWVHGTHIGIAESKDGITWKYKDTANINYRPDSGYTFWAPGLIYNKGMYHMYLTYVPGVFTNWSHPRVIVHLTSKDLVNWQYESTLHLATEKVIDACVYQTSDSTWRLWYNNERDGKSIYYADSKDLYHWEDKGKAIAARGEGPVVFHWQDQYFMIVDVWKGMEVYNSNDLLHWTKQTTRILENPGKGKDDQAIGGHCDVVVNNGKAYIYYFTHPGIRKDIPAAPNSFEGKRSVIQLAELHYTNGEITCDRDEAVAGFKLPVTDNPQPIYLFCYFKNNGQDGLHLAYSTDGYTFSALHNDTGFLRPTVSKDKLMRDPCIIRGADNLFHMVWTVSWKDRGIGYASSPDLVHWSEQQYLPVMEKEPTAQNCWAPEITYDSKHKQYMLYWATTIPGRFPATDTMGDGNNNHRIYYTTTKDFKTYSDTKLLYDDGFNVIDATIQPDGKQFIMFLKDETKRPVPQKNLHIATSNTLTGGYSKASPAITGNYWAEGPTAIKINGAWVVYFDKYRDRQYGAITSTDLEHWTDISDKLNMPKGIRHGTVFRITKEELAVLQ